MTAIFLREQGSKRLHLSLSLARKKEAKTKKSPLRLSLKNFPPSSPPHFFFFLSLPPPPHTHTHSRSKLGGKRQVAEHVLLGADRR